MSLSSVLIVTPVADFHSLNFFEHHYFYFIFFAGRSIFFQTIYISIHLYTYIVMACDDPCVCEKFRIDYYGVLGIEKSADNLEIKKAFRRLAIRYNPERQENKQSSAANFSLIAEAYDVLSDPLKRAVYDQYGEEGLKKGAPGVERFIQPYVYHGEPMRTYREFFGTDSPYADLLDALSKPKDWHQCAEGRGTKRKEEALVRPLPLTLSEVFFGGMKKMKIERLVFENERETETVLRQSVLTVPIKPGVPTGTEFVFAAAGDQSPSKIPADIIFVTEERPHETFKREGANLLMTVRIFLREALVGTIVTVNTIDGRTFRVPITSVVTPDYEKLVAGEGLPLPDDPEQLGDLVIKFDVEFPMYLPPANRNHVKKAFQVRRPNGKGRRNVDDDIPIRRDRDDDSVTSNMPCTN